MTATKQAWYERFVVKCGGRYLEDRADRTSWTDNPRKAAEYTSAESAQCDADSLTQGVQFPASVEKERVELK